MRCFSLFAGIGAFDLAVRNQGHETVPLLVSNPGHAKPVYPRTVRNRRPA